MKMPKRIICIILSLLMMISSVPVASIIVFADNTDITIDFDYAKNLGSTDPAVAFDTQSKKSISTKTVDEDYYKSNQNKFQWRHITAETPLTIADNDKGSLRYWLQSTSEDDKYITLDRDLSRTYQGNTEWKTINITSDKVLDLNGFSIDMNYGRNRKGDINSDGHYDQSNDAKFHNSTMFTISKGATLTIIDSSKWRKEGITNEGTGGIKFHGYMVSPYYTSMDFYTTRDLFHVDNGNLVIYGGTFQAGRSKEQVKSNFSWETLKIAFGSAVALGVSVAEYTNGIDVAKATLKDVNETVRKEKKASEEKDDGKDTPKGETSIIEKDGKNQNPTKEQTKSTPSKESSGKPDEGRNQTIGEKNEAQKKENEKNGTNKPVDDKNKSDDKKSKSIDWNSRIAEAEKGVVNSIVNEKGLTGMFDKAIKLVEDIGKNFGNDENSRLTQSIMGTVVRVSNASTFVSYGGTFKGYGSTPNTRNAVVEVAHEPGIANTAKAYIYDGTFVAYTGANVFNFIRANATQKRFQVVKDTDGNLKQSVVMLKDSETAGVEQVFYENANDVAKNGAEPKLVDTSSVKVRGGTFRNYYSMFNLAICEDSDPSSGKDNFKKFPGTPGGIGLGTESFDADFIRDGRIQIEDRYGVGALVLMDDEKDTDSGIYHYRLYCSDQELRYKQYLVVYPNKAVTNSNYSMRLESYYGDGANKDISKAWEVGEGNTRDSAFSNAEKYFAYRLGDETAYVEPKLNATNPLASPEELNASAVWYYNTPKDANNNPLPDFSYADTYFTATTTKDTYYNPSLYTGGSVRPDTPTQTIPAGSTVTVSAWKDAPAYWNLIKNASDSSKISYKHEVHDNYRNTMKWFKYKIYRVDPLTKNSISESWKYGEDKPLAQVVYGESGDSLKCKLPIADLQNQLLARNNDADADNDVMIKVSGGGYEKWTGYKKGELYRIELSIDEYINFGFGADEVDAQLDVASSETSVIFACYDDDEITDQVDPETHHKVEDYTPLQWETEPAGGKYAKINLTNAMAGLVDYSASGSKIFDVYYQWWEVDSNGKPVKLLAGTDNIYTGYSGKDYQYNLAQKIYHMPIFWDLDSNGMPKDGHNYINTVDPSDSNKASYNANGLLKSSTLWTSANLHAYTKEICGSENAKMLNLDSSKNQSLENNDVFKTNSDTCYIPTECAGKIIRVKAVAVNVKWSGDAYDLYDDYGNVKRFGVAYDKIQTFWSHPVTLESTKATITIKAPGNRYAVEQNIASTSEVVEIGSEYVLPEMTHQLKDAYVFTGWNVGNPGDKIKVTGNIELVPACEYAEAVVSFDANGSSGSMPAVTTKLGSSYTLPQNGFSASKTNGFLHWNVYYKASSESTKWAGSILKLKPGDKITINPYYKYYVVRPEFDTYTATLDSNGGSGSMSSIKADINGKITLPQYRFVPPVGKKFAKWDLGNEGATVTLSGNSVIKAVYAGVTVKYDANGGSGSMANNILSGYFTCPECAFTPKSGYTFAYWSMVAGGREYGPYYPNQLCYVANDITLKANWTTTGASIDVVFESAIDGITLPSNTKTTVENGFILPEALPDIEPSADHPYGMFFRWWKVTVGYESGVDPTYDIGPGKPLTLNGAPIKVTVVPVFADKEKITISFDGRAYVNGNYRSPDEEPQDVEIILPDEKTIEEPEVVPSIEGFTFEGWTDGGVVVEDFAKHEFTSSKTLNAKWTQNEYEINSVISGNGSFDVTNMQNKTIETAHFGDRISINFHPDEGYEVDSYKIIKDSDGSVLYEREVSPYDTNYMTYCSIPSFPSSSVTVELNFREKHYTISKDSDGPYSTVGGYNDWGYKAIEGDIITFAPFYTEELVKFGKIIVIDSLNRQTDISESRQFVMPKGDVTISAEWEYLPKYYYKVFAASEGNGSAEISTNTPEYGEIVNLSATADDGYGFKQWDVYNAESGDYLGEASNVLYDEQFEFTANSFKYISDNLGKLKFVAVFEETPKVKVSFDAGGQRGKMVSLTITKGDSIVLPESGFYTLECLEFDKWSAGKPGDMITVDKDTVITAKWKSGNHEYYDGIAIKAATCTAAGIREYYCVNCGELVESRNVPAKGHVFEPVSAVEATCTADGKSAGVVCAVCGAVQSGCEVVPAKGHSFDTGKVTKVATCAQEGVKTFTCSVCGTTKSEAIAKTAHSFDGGKVTKKATCTQEGIKTYTCTVCETTKTESIAKTEHSYKNIVTKATLSKDGKITPTCSLCGATKKATTIAKASKVTASKVSFVYTGKAQKPSVSVKDSAGKVIDSKNYTVTYSNSSSKNVGTYSVSVKFKGNYSATKTFNYSILPKQVTGVKASNVATTSMTLKWTKVTGAKYYKIEQSADGKKWKTIATASTNSAKVKSLKAGTVYQFRVTALDSSKKLAGKASTVAKLSTLTASPSISLKSNKSAQATVSWKKVAGAKAYVVYKSTDGKNWTKVTTTTKTSYTLTKLTGGKRIYVKVQAQNANKLNSAFSSSKYVTVKK